MDAVADVAAMRRGGVKIGRLFCDFPPLSSLPRSDPKPIKTVYTIPDDTEFRATSIAWKLPYFELKKYITKIRLPSQNGIKIQV